jgi:putative flippase GtrA
MSKYMSESAFQLARFAAVSLFCFALGLGVLTGLHELVGVHYLIAYVASFVVTSSLGYLLNGRYTFRAPGGNTTGLLRYMLVNVGLLLINGSALRLLVEHFHVWYLSATLLLAALNTPVSFLAHRLVSYRLGLRQPVDTPPPDSLRQFVTQDPTRVVTQRRD